MLGGGGGCKGFKWLKFPYTLYECYVISKYNIVIRVITLCKVDVLIIRLHDFATDPYKHTVRLTFSLPQKKTPPLSYRYVG